jgi:hypothetical protein
VLFLHLLNVRERKLKFLSNLHIAQSQLAQEWHHRKFCQILTFLFALLLTLLLTFLKDFLVEDSLLKKVFFYAQHIPYLLFG